MKHSKKWFTLVELVVVAVILSILATVGFISYEEYITDTRDSKRMAQLAWLRDGLRLWITKWKLPLPDDNIEIRNNWTPFLYQWYAGENVLEWISYSEATKDPYDDTYYTYLVSRNRKDFQILGFLEEYNPDVISSIVTESYAIDYSQRFAQVMGKKLWILLEQETNTPLQELPEYIWSWYLDLQDTTTNLFDAYITDTQLISWNEIDLIGIIPFTTCKKIKETGWSYGNGIYNINPSGLSPFEVYCDMEIDGWGWTLIARSILSGAWDFGWLIKRWLPRDEEQVYSMWVELKNFNFNDILFTTYASWKDIDIAVKVWIDKNFVQSWLKNPLDDNSQSISTSGCITIEENIWVGYIDPCIESVDAYWKFWKNTNYFHGWNTTHDNGFYPDGYYPHYRFGAFTNYDGVTSNTATSKQGMIFVR